MAQIVPFRAYRYSSRAGDPARLFTQPYDKITPEMQQRYFSLSPYNLAHIIRGQSNPADTETDNVYTRAAAYLENWISTGLLTQEPEASLYAYFQKFQAPDSGRSYLRKGLIALGAVEDYSQGTVFRHELTHTGPKRDRLELLRRTRAHCGQIFMLYDDPKLAVDACLDRVAHDAPITCVTDEYGAEHSLWRIDDPGEVAQIQRLLAPSKLLIADGHHRYETALAFRKGNPNLSGAAHVMMTLVNLRSPGLVILPTHRVVANLPPFDAADVLRRAEVFFTSEVVSGPEALAEKLDRAAPDRVVVGAMLKGDPRCFVFAVDPAQLDALLPNLNVEERRLDVVALHQVLLAQVLGLTEQAVREENNIRYVRGREAAARSLEEPDVQAVFFLRPVGVQQVAEVAFSGGVMPQKSTDFYPKLLSGLTIYRIES